MNGIDNHIYSLEQAASKYLTQKKEVTNDNSTQLSFDEIFNNKANVVSKNQLVFSKHANERLESRNINLTEGQVERLNEGVAQAREKSINESLVMMDNLAFIVSVNNNTVITALDQDSSDNKVFTNIDGAVIV